MKNGRDHRRTACCKQRNACGWNTMQDVVEAMRTGDTYLNVHTSQNPSGEVRGQIAASP